MGPEIITISAGGSIWSAFESVSVEAAYNEAARSFSFEIAAELGPQAAAWTFAAGTPIEILANGDLVCAGFVDRYQPEIDEHSSAKATVSGRSKAQDVIDSAALHDTGEFRNKTVLQIAQALDQFGVGFASKAQLAQIPVYRITPGESVFRVVEKLCRSQELTLCGQPDGSILIAKGAQGSHAPLIEGVNIKKASADHNWAGRHSKAIVRGQRPIGTGKANLQIEQTAQDGAVQRNRPVLIVMDDDTDDTRAKTRAKHRLAKEAGAALRANVTVQGWRDDGGALWTPGNLVWLESPFLDVQQMMLVEKCHWSQARGSGSLAQLALCDPQAYAADGGKGGSAGDAWSTDAGGAGGD